MVYKMYFTIKKIQLKMYLTALKLKTCISNKQYSRHFIVF